MSTKHSQLALNLAAAIMVLILLVAVAVPAADAQDQSNPDKSSKNDNISASFDLGKDASAKDVGTLAGLSLGLRLTVNHQ